MSRAEELIGFFTMLALASLFGAAGVACWVQAFTEWRWYAAGLQGPFLAVLVGAFGLLFTLLAARGAMLAVRVLQGATTMRLARRDYFDLLPSLLLFFKTGFWGK